MSKKSGPKRAAIALSAGEGRTEGPGAHSHAEDDIFYVIEGTMSVLIGDRWVDAPSGSFVLVPGGMTHDFQNRSGQRAGILNFSIPGNFETEMSAIAEWLRNIRRRTHNPALTATSSPARLDFLGDISVIHS